MDQVPQSHKFFGVSFNSSFPSPKLFCSDIQIDYNILCHLQHILQSLFLPPFIKLQHIVFLYFICFLTYYKPFILSVIQVDNLDIVLCDCQTFIYGFRVFLSVFDILNLLQLPVEDILSTLALVNSFLVLFVLVYFQSLMHIKSEILIQQVICQNS